jgi:hypothetical protein
MSCSVCSCSHGPSPISREGFPSHELGVRDDLHQRRPRVRQRALCRASSSWSGSVWGGPRASQTGGRDRGRVGEERENAHLTTTRGTEKRQHPVDPSEQSSPADTSGVGGGSGLRIGGGLWSWAQQLGAPIRCRLGYPTFGGQAIDESGLGRGEGDDTTGSPEPFEREGRPGTVAEQAFDTCSVLAVDPKQLRLLMLSRKYAQRRIVGPCSDGSRTDPFTPFSITSQGAPDAEVIAISMTGVSRRAEPIPGGGRPRAPASRRQLNCPPNRATRPPTCGP